MTISTSGTAPDREELAANILTKRLTDFNPTFVPLSEVDRRRSLLDTLEAASPEQPVAVFAYGSLMWNPSIRYRANLAATAYGYHRRFCLNTSVARGTAECPGLMLGLAAGGSCRGRALLLEDDDLEAELMLLWRRELVDDAYVPRWIHCKSEVGDLKAIAFVANRDHQRFVAGTDPITAARQVAFAIGAFGSCYDYASETLLALARFRIRDRALEDVIRRADFLRAEASEQQTREAVGA